MWLKLFIIVFEVLFDSIIWLKFDKWLFDIGKDFYIVFIYILFEGSVFYFVYNIEIFDILEDSVVKYIFCGNVFIMVDLNSRCGIVVDFIEFDIIDKILYSYILSVLSYILDEEIIKCRIEDKNIINFYGCVLIFLCKLM